MVAVHWQCHDAGTQKSIYRIIVIKLHNKRIKKHVSYNTFTRILVEIAQLIFLKYPFDLNIMTLNVNSNIG